MMPLVSVVMPLYNGEKYINEAINSVLSQTYKNFELILVEDGSTDNTLNKITLYNDPRIRLFINKKNRGISFATNKGVSESKGKYIALLDDDDIAEKDRLMLQVSYMEEHEDIDILGGRTTYINEAGKILDYSCIPRKNPKYIKAMLLFECMDFMNGTAMIRKQFIHSNNLSYEENCFGMQDFKFYIDSSKVGKISTINHFLLKHRLHGENTTDRSFQQKGTERAQKYAEFQRYSLEKSGFVLEDHELLLINKLLPEVPRNCVSINELNMLYAVFYKIISQAISSGADYIEELKHYFKKRLSELLVKMDIFGGA